MHSAISGRSTTTVSTAYRSSIRCSAGGDSGSSATGYRCTDLDSTDARLTSRLQRKCCEGGRSVCAVGVHGLAPRGRKRMHPARFRCKMSGVATYQGRALAEVNLTGRELGEALELFISRRDPSLE